MIKSLLLLNLLCLTISLNAQSVFTGLGARAESMGNAAAGLTDAWSVFHNPGGLAWTKKTAAIFSYSAAPLLEGADRMGAAVLVPVMQGAGGVSIFRFGDALYSESVASVSYANRLGLAGLGVKLNYLQYRTEGFGSHGVVTLDLGGIAELTPQLRVGARIQNINRPALNDDGDHAPVIMQAGICLTPTDKVVVVTELYKDLDHVTTWKAGLEYAIHPRVWLRSGFNIKPNASFFGAGFHIRKIQFDYALQYSTYLRLVHQGSVVYKLKGS